MRARRLTVCLTVALDVPDERFAAPYAEDALHRALILGLANGTNPDGERMDLMCRGHDDKHGLLPATVTINFGNHYL